LLIIIEGVDGAGKSTLSNDISDALPLNHFVEQLHRGVPEDHPLDEYELPFLDYVPGTNHHIICDRWHLGTDVYGPVMRNDQGLPLLTRWHMNAYFKAKGALLVYAEMPVQPLMARLQERGDDYLPFDKVEDIIRLYWVAIEKSPLDKMHSLTGVHNTDAVIARGQSAEQEAIQSGSIRSYVGPRRPQYLFVGESPTPIAFMPYEGTESAKIVSRALAIVGHSTCGFIDCRDDLARVWDALYNPQVITIDDAATQACYRANVPFRWMENENK
jgi:thymidylate kinase